MDEVRLQASLEELRRQVEDLSASRTRLVAAGDDLRRTIERDLHDGAQQQLVAVGVKLQLARGLADTDAAAMRSLLDEIGRDVHDALEDVRRLAWHVYPSLLLDAGLADALRAAASELAVSTRVEAELPGRYPSDVENTVYFSCLELLRAAAGAPVTVRLREGRRAVLFAMRIRGIDAGRWETCDLTGVGDRIGSHGGRLTVTTNGCSVAIGGAVPFAR